MNLEKHIRESGQHPGWTPELVAKRLQEAADTLKRLPDKNRPRPLKASWPDTVQAMAESVFAIANVWGVNIFREREKEKNDSTLRPGPPDPGAISRMDKALPWLAYLDTTKQKPLWAWACGCGDRRIAMICGKHRHTIRAWREQSLELIARRLNG